MIRPKISELDFIASARNHQELAAKIRKIVGSDAADSIGSQATYVGVRWILLGGIHLREARIARRAGLIRGCYSKAYYSAYNFSKGVRYLVKGQVSLKGDDHQSAPDFPPDFPDRDAMGRAVTDLYACRLQADYDNWGTGSQPFSLSSAEAISLANKISKNSRKYISERYGAKVLK